MREILAWTGGQPFLTQKVCKLLRRDVTVERLSHSAEQCRDVPVERLSHSAEQCRDVPVERLSHSAEQCRDVPVERLSHSAEQCRDVPVERLIEELVRSHVIKHWESQDEPEHLRTIRDRILQNQQRAGRLLGLYQQILQRGEVAGDDSSEQMELRLSGLVVKEQVLKVSNRIYAEVFNQSWVDEAFAKLRPYAQALTAWFDSGCQDESRLLRGQTLRDAQTWTVGKSLSDQDYQFLAASQQLDRQEVQIALDAERQAKQILADARQKAEIALEEERQANQRLAQAQQKTRRQTYIGAAILGVTLLGAVGVAALAEQARRRAFSISEVEQQGSYALEQFKSNKNESVQSLVMAMKAGQTLKGLVKEKPSIVDYPTLSPILSIQEILPEIEEKNTLEGHSGSVTSVAFSSDGKTIASGSYDNTIKIWYFDLDNLLSRGCHKLKAYLISHAEALEPLTFCQEQNPDILLAATPFMVTAGETAARNGNFEDALAKFKTAKKWNSKLDINPEVKTASLRFEFAGRDSAKKGDFDGAVTNFKQAKQLNVKIDFDTDTDGVQNDPEKVAKELVSQALVKQAREIADKGDVDAVVAKFKQAQQLNAKIDLDDNTEGVQTNPQAVAKKLVSQALVQQGKDVATQGNFDGAVAKFKQAQQLDAKIDLDDNTDGVQTNIQAVTKHFISKGLVDQGKQLARQGDINDAVAKLKQAQRIQPKIDINPDIDGVQNNPEKVAQDFYIAGLIDEAEEQLKQDEYRKAQAVYKRIENLKPTKENLAKSENSFCRQASLQGYVKNVVNDACEKAVKLAPNNANIRDSRGLARALTGNFQGAIEDFQVFIESTNDADAKELREAWVKDLQAGNNPFTPEVLEKLHL
ncbi:MAG: hypothetical protein KME54_10865 [Tolypothrix brevis GSE-NOS-MK-07-07A]|nr:hypothetical protein [Tolypothrix brevis GSE-NOS-MK-07-07A]